MIQQLGLMMGVADTEVVGQMVGIIPHLVLRALVALIVTVMIQPRRLT